MTIQQATAIGFAADKLSKQIIGSEDTSITRTTMSTTLGGVGGLIAVKTVIISVSAIGGGALATAAAPVVIPLAVASATFGFLKSLF